jgi:peptidoglycan/xylan/chitin deacetylase (PgdA/CDA1 family)
VRARIALFVAVVFALGAAVPATAAAASPGSSPSAAVESSARVQPAVDTPKFLTLPFNSLRHMVLQQGWDFADGQHKAIDYIKGRKDVTSTWKGFPVVAAADGKACGERRGRNGCMVRPGIMGHRVAIKHRVGDEVYWTFYNHLDSIDPAIPTGSRHNMAKVTRGQVIGYAGASGNPSYLIHLHFQLLDADFQPLDPYGIYGPRERYPDPKGQNGKLSKRRHYWTTNPPTMAPPPEEETPQAVHGGGAAAAPASHSAAAAGSATGGSATAATNRAVSGRFAAGGAVGPLPRIPAADLGHREPAAAAQYITHGNRNRKWIALTFDADMYPFMYRDRDTYTEYDQRLLDLLLENDIPATIFFNGLYAKAYPDVVADLAARPSIETANHTWDHAGWVSCGNTDPIRPPMTKTKEVTKAATILKNVTAIDVRYFRFPGGCYGSGDIRLVKNLAETPIGWDCYFGDALGWSAERQVANVKSTCQKGSIVITHFNNTRYHPGVYRALKQLLRWWDEHGWEVVNVGTMLGKPTPPPD